MTDGVRKVMQDMTGQTVGSCPWRALRDPLVVRVLAVMPFFESGQLAYVAPQPSHRLLCAVRYYETCYNSMYSKQQEADRKDNQRTAKVASIPNPIRGRR